MENVHNPEKTADKKHHLNAHKTWPKEQTEATNVIDIDAFLLERPPAELAATLKRWAESPASAHMGGSTSTFHAAMQMLELHETRNSKHASPEQKRLVDDAKQELRRLYGHEAAHPMHGTQRGAESQFLVNGKWQAGPAGA